MTQRTWFSLALRILGVMQLIDAVRMLVQAHDIQLKVFTPQVSTVAGSLHFAFACGVMGFTLLLGAPFFSGLLIKRDPATP